MFMQMKFEASWIKRKVNFKYSNGITVQNNRVLVTRYAFSEYIYYA